MEEERICSKKIFKLILDDNKDITRMLCTIHWTSETLNYRKLSILNQGFERLISQYTIANSNSLTIIHMGTPGPHKFSLLMHGMISSIMMSCLEAVLFPANTQYNNALVITWEWCFNWIITWLLSCNTLCYHCILCQLVDAMRSEYTCQSRIYSHLSYITFLLLFISIYIYISIVNLLLLFVL